MIQTIIIAFIVYLVLTSIRRMVVNPRVHIDVNEQEGATTLRALYVIAHEIAHADGEEDEREREMVVRMVRELLGRPDLDKAFILREYREHGKKQMSDAELRSLSLHYRRMLFHCALFVARSDLRLTAEEARRLSDVARRLDLPEADILEKFAGAGINREDVERMFGSRGQRNMRERAYEVLGVNAEATAAQIKKAYRRKAMAAHPDRVKEEDKAAATAKFKEIQEAYSILSRGMPS